MESEAALTAFAALSQATRLAVFQLLMEHEPEGLAAGVLAEELAVPPNTLSTHLAVLSRAGLVTQERRSRHIIYRADTSQVRALVSFLVDKCCAAHPDVCGLPANPAGCLGQKT